MSFKENAYKYVLADRDAWKFNQFVCDEIYSFLTENREYLNKENFLFRKRIIFNGNAEWLYLQGVTLPNNQKNI